MKLTTVIGQIDLPRDFALTMKRNNPLLNGEGDFSVPSKLPSSTNNLMAIGHLERIDRAKKYNNKLDAILEVGPVRKRGQLVMDTVHPHEGIDASFGIDNSDLYAKSKKKTLKEIFGDHRLAFFASSQAAFEKLQGVYEGIYTEDYVVFPVAIAPYEVDDGHGNKTKVYQYNNEISPRDGQLVWQARYVHEGDVDQMSVPQLYGLAPFLKLSRLMVWLFKELGYEVTYNCLEDWPFQRMVIVHNCSDCLCNPNIRLYFRDLVPSCTLSDFLAWLNNKFHVQPVVDSETMQVKIVAMEAMLTLAADIDISELKEGDFKVQLNPTKRIVMTPSNKIEGTEPAAATFDKLIEKYDTFDYVNEGQFLMYPTANPPTNAPLVLRRASGQFYGVEYDSDIQKYVLKLLGTNHFTYDRANSEDTEEVNQADSIPLMLVEGKMQTVPFIGDRIHAHTSYKGSTAEDTQDIIVVQAVTNNNFAYKTTGTTQPCIPYLQMVDGQYFFELGVGVCPYDLYESCWQRYNTILLNHPTHFIGRVDYSIGQVLGMDMTRMKHCLGQQLMPVTATSKIGQKPTLTDAEFILVKTFVDGITDSAILPESLTDLIWEISDNADEVAWLLWLQIYNAFTPSQGQGIESDDLYYCGYDINYVGDNLQPGVPQYEGETKTLTRLAIITIHYQEVFEYPPDYLPSSDTFNYNATFNNQTVTFTFVAVQP